MLVVVVGSPWLLVKDLVSRGHEFVWIVNDSEREARMQREFEYLDFVRFLTHADAVSAMTDDEWRSALLDPDEVGAVVVVVDEVGLTSGRGAMEAGLNTLARLVRTMVDMPPPRVICVVEGAASMLDDLVPVVARTFDAAVAAIDGTISVEYAVNAIGGRSAARAEALGFADIAELEPIGFEAIGRGQAVEAWEREVNSAGRWALYCSGVEDPVRVVRPPGTQWPADIDADLEVRRRVAGRVPEPPRGATGVVHGPASWSLLLRAAGLLVPDVPTRTIGLALSRWAVEFEAHPYAALGNRLYLVVLSLMALG